MFEFWRGKGIEALDIPAPKYVPRQEEGEEMARKLIKRATVAEAKTVEEPVIPEPRCVGELHRVIRDLKGLTVLPAQKSVVDGVIATLRAVVQDLTKG